MPWVWAFLINWCAVDRQESPSETVQKEKRNRNINEEFPTEKIKTRKQKRNLKLSIICRSKISNEKWLWHKYQNNWLMIYEFKSLQFLNLPKMSIEHLTILPLEQEWSVKSWKHITNRHRKNSKWSIWHRRQ